MITVQGIYTERQNFALDNCSKQLRPTFELFFSLQPHFPLQSPSFSDEGKDIMIKEFVAEIYVPRFCLFCQIYKCQFFEFISLTYCMLSKIVWKRKVNNKKRQTWKLGLGSVVLTGIRFPSTSRGFSSTAFTITEGYFRDNQRKNAGTPIVRWWTSDCSSRIHSK